MTTCPTCLLATRRPSNRFRDGCQGCRAREIARGPAFWASRRGGALTSEYRAQIDAACVAHAQVKEAAERDHPTPEGPGVHVHELPGHASPSVGSMGARQPADAGPPAQSAAGSGT